MTAALEPTQAEVRRWMRRELQYDVEESTAWLVDPTTNLANLTRLAEAAAERFDHDCWLDDETHWVWDLAIEAAEAEGYGERP